MCRNIHVGTSIRSKGPTSMTISVTLTTCYAFAAAAAPLHFKTTVGLLGLPPAIALLFRRTRHSTRHKVTVRDIDHGE